MDAGTTVEPTATPASALDVATHAPMDYLSAGLSKILDTYVQIDANAHGVQPANSATYRVPGTGQSAPVGSSGVVASHGLSTGVILLLVGAAVLGIFLIVKK